MFVFVHFAKNSIVTKKKSQLDSKSGSVKGLKLRVELSVAYDFSSSNKVSTKILFHSVSSMMLAKAEFLQFLRESLSTDNEIDRVYATLALLVYHNNGTNMKVSTYVAPDTCSDHNI